MENQNNETKIVFYSSANDEIYNLIEKFKLKEVSKNGAPSNFILIHDLIRDFSLEKITEKDAKELFKKTFGIDEDAITKIWREISNNILPLTEKVTKEQLQDPIFSEKLSHRIWGEPEEELKTEEPETPKIKKPIGVLNALKREMQQSEISGMTEENENEYEPEVALPFEEKPTTPIAPQPEPEPEPTPEPEEESAPQQKSSDSYRESVDE